MIKSIIIIVLGLLLVTSVVAGFYLFQISIDNKGAYQDKIEELESSNKDLTKKTEESLLYIRALDWIMELSRQEFNLETKRETSEAEWLRNLSDAVDKTGDVKLQSIFKRITTSESDQTAAATVEFVDYAIKIVLDYLKIK